MKKVLSLVLAGLLVVAMVPTVVAAEIETTDVSNGTNVVYVGTGEEEYTITVPATLIPGGDAGVVEVHGTMASNRKLTVTAPETVVLTNDINNQNTKTLAVNFEDIVMFGDNTVAVSAEAEISVAAITDALFGNWTGKIVYTVTPGDVQ